MKIKILLLALLFFSMGFAQQRNCGMEQLMEEKLSDPASLIKYQEMQNAFNVELNKNKANGKTAKALLTIPVAVHFPTGNNSDRACLVALAQNQIDILNDDYNSTNADQSNWGAASSFYPGVTPGVAELQFCIATLDHPANTDPNLVEGEPAVTIGYNFGNGGEADVKWQGYMNFIVKYADGYLGYSPLGGDFDAGEAVVMDTAAFGSGSGCTGFVPGAPYDLGRTVTHELGHFFNLDHTFGNDNGCSGNTDYVDDTPKVGNATYGTPAPGSVAGCNSPEKALTMSYMDYVNDTHMYMFSGGQIERARAFLDANASKLKQGVTECGTLSVDEYANQGLPSIFPNPNNGSFTIEFNPDPSTPIKVMVYDLAGRTVLEKTYDPTTSLFSKKINLNRAQAGVYLVSIENGRGTTVKKIIVE